MATEMRKICAGTEDQGQDMCSELYVWLYGKINFCYMYFVIYM